MSDEKSVAEKLKDVLDKVESHKKGPAPAQKGKAKKDGAHCKVAEHGCSSAGDKVE